LVTASLPVIVGSPRTDSPGRTVDEGDPLPKEKVEPGAVVVVVVVVVEMMRVEAPMLDAAPSVMVLPSMI